MVPAYFYPGPLWTQLLTAPSGSIIIANPNSGPGASPDPNYVAVIGAAQNVGLIVVGYVYTNYGARPEADVKADIDSWKAWYGVNGIFLDQGSTDPAELSYYGDLASYIRATPGRFVVLNPGITPDQQYMPLADVICIFEDPYSAFLTYTPPSWIGSYAAKVAILVHTTATAAQMTNAFALSLNSDASYVYVTDDVLPNPWDTMPSYWTAELAQFVVQNTLPVVLVPPVQEIGFCPVTASGWTEPMKGDPGTVIFDRYAQRATFLFSSGLVRTFQPVTVAAGEAMSWLRNNGPLCYQRTAQGAFGASRSLLLTTRHCTVDLMQGGVLEQMQP